MTRLTVIVLCCAQLSLVPVVPAQSVTSGQKVRDRGGAGLRHIAEPPELAGEPVTTRKVHKRGTGSEDASAKLCNRVPPLTPEAS